MTGRPINEDKKLAIELGFRTYKGTVHTVCNTNERYVATGGCVHCARVVAAEQREARKYMLAQRIKIDAPQEPVVEEPPHDPIDDLM